MGAYAIYSDKPFIAKGKIKTKRKRGRIDELMELVSDARLETNKETGNIQLVKNGVVIGTFRDDETEDE